MAREHLLIGADEETIHSNQIVLKTRKEKWKNWWQYHWGYPVIGVFAVILFFFMFHSRSTPPDYQIGLITSAAWSDEMMQDLENYIAGYGDDRNHDGEIHVQINQYQLSGGEGTDLITEQASSTRFTVDASNMDSVIFLHDEGGLSYFADGTLSGFFRSTDGTAMPDDAVDVEHCMMDWEEVAAFRAYASPSHQEAMIERTGKEIDERLHHYRVSVRNLSEKAAEKTKTEAYYQDSLALYERLLKNQKINE